MARDCSSCYQSLSFANFPQTSPTPTCTHENSVCTECIKSWIVAQLETKPHDQIKCPECPQILSHANIKSLARPEIYARYEELERRSIQNRIPDWRWCMSPNCRAGQIHTKKKKTPEMGIFNTLSTSPEEGKTAGSPEICVCNACGAKACVSCDRPWHEDETCEQFQARVAQQTNREEEEEMSLAAIKAECKQCPNCRKNIEKDGGCDSVVCTQCNTQFCWHCLNVYSHINRFGHGRGCIYARGADPNAPWAPQSNERDSTDGGESGGIGEFLVGIVPGIQARPGVAAAHPPLSPPRPRRALRLDSFSAVLDDAAHEESQDDSDDSDGSEDY